MDVRFFRGEVVKSFRTEPHGAVGPVTGRTRLVTAREMRAFYENEYPALLKKCGDSVLADAHLYARCIKEWDVTDADGSPVEITPENVSLLNLHVFDQFSAIVTGAAAEPLLGN